MEKDRPSYRSSLRSRDSTSTTDTDPREKIKNCCRKLVAFMCTQVGVGGLVVGYTIVGAFGFIALEEHYENPEVEKVMKQTNNCANSLWSITSEANIFNHTEWRLKVDALLKIFQNETITSIKSGYNPTRAGDMWSFPAALMFSLSVITMIGYGNMVPKTGWGKGVTVIYAVFGIPLYVLYFMNMGKVLAGTFRWIYTWLYNCSTEPEEGGQPRRVIVPSTACLWVIGGYIATGAIMFSSWEGWDYLDSTYFCVTSLCKIGFGDFVPGANILEYRSGNQTKLIINFVYMLLGLGLVAMCYNLMREEVRVKVQEVREDMGQCLEDMRTRFLICCSHCCPTEE